MRMDASRFGVLARGFGKCTLTRQTLQWLRVCLAFRVCSISLVSILSDWFHSPSMTLGSQSLPKTHQTPVVLPTEHKWDPALHAGFEGVAHPELQTTAGLLMFETLALEPDWNATLQGTTSTPVELRKYGLEFLGLGALGLFKTYCLVCFMNGTSSIGLRLGCRRWSPCPPKVAQIHVRGCEVGWPVPEPRFGLGFRV